MESNIWFTSDTHFGHANVIDYDARPFSSIEEHDETIIANWNAVVEHHDVVYHLGDFALSTAEHARTLRSRLNGTIRLLAGNHDDGNRTLSGCWAWVKDLYELKFPDEECFNGRQKMILCHYPLASWKARGKGSWMIHGHTHNKLRDDPNALRLDVCVNAHNYTPVSYQQIKNFMVERKRQIEERGVVIQTLV